jgi:hypothetical protein
VHGNREVVARRRKRRRPTKPDGPVSPIVPLLEAAVAVVAPMLAQSFDIVGSTSVDSSPRYVSYSLK